MRSEQRITGPPVTGSAIFLAGIVRVVRRATASRARERHRSASRLFAFSIISWRFWFSSSG